MNSTEQTSLNQRLTERVAVYGIRHGNIVRITKGSGRLYGSRYAHVMMDDTDKVERFDLAVCYPVKPAASAA